MNEVNNEMEQYKKIVLRGMRTAGAWRGAVKGIFSSEKLPKTRIPHSPPVLHIDENF